MTGENEQMGARGGVLRLLFSPGKVFPELVAQHWLKPALLLAGLNILLAIIIAPKTAAFAVWLVKQGTPQIPPEKLAQVQALAPKAAISGLFLGALVVPWVTWVLVAALLQLFAALSARESAFRALFTVAVYGYLPIFLRTVIANLLFLVTPLENLTVRPQLSLAVFLPPQQSFLYFFLTKFILFSYQLQSFYLVEPYPLGYRRCGGDEGAAGRRHRLPFWPVAVVGPRFGGVEPHGAGAFRSVTI